MNKLLTQVKEFAKKVKETAPKFGRKAAHFVPTRLPQGAAEFEAWANEILDTYGFPVDDSRKFALATMIMHLDATTHEKSKRYFARVLFKGSSNQVAHFVMQDLKAKQDARNKAEEEAKKKQVEATMTSLKVVSNGALEP